MTGGKHNPLNRDIHNDKTPNWGWFIFGFTTLKPLRLSHRWRRQEYLIYSGNFWVSFQVSNRTQRVSKLMRPLITQGSIIHTAALHAPNLDFYTEAKIQQGVAWQTGGMSENCKKNCLGIWWHQSSPFFGTQDPETLISSFARPGRFQTHQLGGNSPCAEHCKQDGHGPRGFLFYHFLDEHPQGEGTDKAWCPELLVDAYTSQYLLGIIIAHN